MKTSIKYSGLEASDSLSDYTTGKLTLLDKLITGRVASAKVELSKTSARHQKGKIFRAECNLRLDGLLLRAEATEDDMYAAIDKMKDELKVEINKHKRKHA